MVVPNLGKVVPAKAKGKALESVLLHRLSRILFMMFRCKRMHCRKCTPWLRAKMILKQTSSIELASEMRSRVQLGTSRLPPCCLRNGMLASVSRMSYQLQVVLLMLEKINFQQCSSKFPLLLLQRQWSPLRLRETWVFLIAVLLSNAVCKFAMKKVSQKSWRSKSTSHSWALAPSGDGRVWTMCHGTSHHAQNGHPL